VITSEEIRQTDHRVAQVARLKAIADRPDVLDRIAILWALEEIQRLTVALSDAQDEIRQQGEIMREQGAELRGAEEEAYQSWCAAQDGAW
jgi:hypothetical protein